MTVTKILPVTELSYAYDEVSQVLMKFSELLGLQVVILSLILLYVSLVWINP
jgi:hypothetical protein